MTAEQSMANRLANEKSPYLLQHAHNPVDWYPWGKEALDKAKAENKPIFLSIGYSSCHWCHVMAKESFASEQLAHLLAENYVAIKVDKEERPDIDAIYMRACQVLTGQGGWPLTLILTPATEPFFAATYLPLESRYNLPGLLKLLEVISERWQNDREELLRNAADFAEFLRQPEEVPKATENWESLLKRGKNTLVRSFDTQYGGFGHFPKFPMPHNLLFLLEYHQWAGDEQSLSMVEKTLEQMYRGGIYDHVGYGFARYSTDEKWLAPHFEKMLYDNALLVMAYLKAYEITGRMLYKKVAEDTITYVFREMRDAAGGFYCAQDADSEGQEGRYYLLAVDEIMTLLGQEDGRYFIHHFAMSPKGNFEGSNIPNLIEADDVDGNDERINTILGTVYAYRLRRAKLHKDDKILTSWNGLMIAALARAYKTLGDERYKEAATQALHFINSRLQNPDGTLRVSYREGETRGLGFLEDYGFLLWAALEMYDACGEKAYLEEALHGAKLMRGRFAAGTGGLYMTDVNSEKLLYRPIETYDGAIPSGNSVAAYALYRLAGLTAEPSVKEFALSQLQFVAGVCSEQPAEHCFALLAGLSSLTTK